MRAAPSSDPALALRIQADHIAAKATGSIGRPPVIADADRVQLLLASLSDGNYRETAIKVAGIPKQSFYNAIKRAEAGDEAAIAFVDAVENAEAMAEAGMVKNWRKAGEAGPQYWASIATFLERKSPDRFGKRADDTTVPKIVVQIGARDSDVTVHVSAGNAGSADITGSTNALIDVTPVCTAPCEEQHKLTEETLSDADTQRSNVATTRTKARKGQR